MTTEPTTPEFGKTLSRFVIDGNEYHASACIDGVLINPQLPEDFDVTPNEERSREEIKLWWDRPFIMVDSWKDVELHIRSNQERLRLEGSEHAVPLEGVDAMIEERRAGWYAEYPAGDRFDVQCLDGGAWDRPTYWGDFGTIEEALQCAARGPAWRQQK